MVREEEIVETLMGGVHGGFWVEFNVFVILAAVLWLASKIQGEGGGGRMIVVVSQRVCMGNDRRFPIGV